jgi:hypothetical protein
MGQVKGTSAPSRRDVCSVNSTCRLATNPNHELNSENIEKPSALVLRVMP